MTAVAGAVADRDLCPRYGLELILGNEFLQWPGNVERFFPLMLGVFILAAALAIRAWHSTSSAGLPATSARADRAAGIVMLVIAAFVVVGLHLPTFVDAIRERPSSVQHLSSPTAFWLVKFMDLGIVWTLTQLTWPALVVDTPCCPAGMPR